MWDGIGDFFAMGGHAPYVWGSFGVLAGLILVEFLLLGRRRRRVLFRLNRRAHQATSSHL